MKELGWEIAETHRMLRRHYDRRAASLGVTSAQWRVLVWLSREPGLKQAELAQRLDVEPITAGRTIDRMEQSGLVTRRHDPVDRRAWRLYLTDRAQPVLEGLRLRAEDMAEEVFAGLSMEELEAMRSQLARIRDNVGRAERAERKSA